MGKKINGNFGASAESGVNTKGEYYQKTKKLLENYENLRVQTSSFERMLKEKYKSTFVDVDIEKMTAEEIAEMMITRDELCRSEVKLLEYRRSYLKTKYMIQLIDGVLSELKTRENGLIQYEIINEVLLKGKKMSDIEEIMAEKGCPIGQSTAYRTISQGIHTLSMMLWGAVAFEFNDSDMSAIFSEETLSLFNMVA